jgi:hypothetical protein
VAGRRTFPAIGALVVVLEPGVCAGSVVEVLGYVRPGPNLPLVAKVRLVPSTQTLLVPRDLLSQSVRREIDNEHR